MIGECKDQNSCVQEYMYQINPETKSESPSCDAIIFKKTLPTDLHRFGYIETRRELSFSNHMLGYLGIGEYLDTGGAPRKGRKQ